MGWLSTKWEYSSGLKVSTIGTTPSYLYKLVYEDSLKTFNKSKTYQLVTSIENLYTPGLSLSSTLPKGGEIFNYDYQSSLVTVDNLPSSPGTGNLYQYSSPKISIDETSYVVYSANNGFGNSYAERIQNTKINDLDWKIQGYSFFHTVLFPGTVSSTDTMGWHYDDVSNSYMWYDTNLNTKYPVGGSYNSKVSNIGYRDNNYISRYIGYSYFNLAFKYNKQFDIDGGIYIYLSQNLPSEGVSSLFFSATYSVGSVLIATMTGSTDFDAKFYGLKGNQYLYIVGIKSSTTSLITLSDLKVDGGYNSGNNNQWLMTNSSIYSNPTVLSPIGLVNATYSLYTGYGNTVNATSSLSIFKINTLIGNGEFKSGIWENGVWNSGWRDDTNLQEFYSIGGFFDYNRGKQWRFIINGPESSASKFSVGNKVSIGNIVAIDINNDRKLIKSYFTIISVLVNSIVVELTNNFPLVRVEIDSPNHRISVTKNVWLSGAFLNGYFTGIWNYGLFKGYPEITEMNSTHWIDGVFDGGHYKSNKLESYFVGMIYTPPSGSVSIGPKLGLTFSTPHRLNIGDEITINKDNILLNPEYNKKTVVTSVVNEYQIVTDIDWIFGSSTESGWIYTNISDGVIQNFDFKSNNVSKITSIQSLDSDIVFSYNSWIDVGYSTMSAVSIGKPLTLIDKLSRRTYSENNLYGWPTNDVLSSISSFRDSYSLNIKNYKLGTKYKIFNDYIGDSSKFEDYFGKTGSDASLFIDYGWTYSISGSLTFSRTVDSGIDPIIGEELSIEAIGSGGVLDFYIKDGIINRTNVDVEKLRYTMVEFDLLTYSVNNDYFVNNQIKLTKLTKNKGSISEPVIHFNNINTIIRDVDYLPGVTFSATDGSVHNFISPSILNSTYLPIYTNVDHLSSTGIRKYEYFYNKRNLSMYFKGSGLYGASQSSFVIDNLKYFEIDMVPFFKYFNEENINFGVEVPYQGVAPLIDYTNSNFSFIDNISLGLGSIYTKNSYVPISGVDNNSSLYN